MCMVCAGAKPSLRLASCCRVEVVKGGGGLRLAGFASTEATVKARGLQRLLEGLGLGAGADVEALDLLAVGADEAGLEGVAARRGERRRPATSIRAATNFSISSSRSQTSRSATDCTRPAERAPGSLRHSTGESVKPTR